jgi:hypothetical protein
MPKPLPGITKARRCKHSHLSGRRCEARIRKPQYFAGAPLWVCGPHRAGECDECDSMLRAFPIRKTVPLT